MISRHHLDALEARPHDVDVDSLRATAVEWLVRAAERALSTGAQATAARLFASAAERTCGPDEADETVALRSADLWMHAAKAGYEEADYDAASPLRTTPRGSGAHGHARLVAVIQALRGRALRRSGRGGQARTDLLAAMAVLEEEPGLDTVEVAASLATVSALDEYDDADEVTARAISLAERLGADDRVLADVFSSRGLMLNYLGRRLEAIGYLRQSLAFAEACGDPLLMSNPLGNLADVSLFASPREGLDYTQRSIDVARQTGSRYGIGISTINAILCLLRLGDWDEADRTLVDALDRDSLGDIPEVTTAAALVWSLRGEVARAREVFQPMTSVSADAQAAAYDALVLAQMTSAEGDPVAALRTAREGLANLSPTIDPFVLLWPLAARLAHEAGDRDALNSVLGISTATTSARSRRWCARNGS